MTFVTEKEVVEETTITPLNLALLRETGDIGYLNSETGHLYALEEVRALAEKHPELKRKVWMRNEYRIADLFAGIGGTRLGVARAFGDRARFVFANEIDKYACETYRANFGENPLGDIEDVDPDDLPDFDLLLAGFPCQPFSIAGRKEGFRDKKGRGNLFFYIANILEAKRPASFLLENVRHFMKHDGGRTFATVKRILTEDLGYEMHAEILNAKDFGLPQHRERIYMAGFDGDVPFSFPEPTRRKARLNDILESDVPAKYYISQQYLNTLKAHKKRHREAGHGFGYEVLDPEGIAHALVGGGMGLERNLVRDRVLSGFYGESGDDLGLKNEEGLRKLTPRECARLQGFRDDFVIPVADTRSFRQFANAVPVPVIKAISKQILLVLDSN